jgi:hypothetical protein
MAKVGTGRSGDDFGEERLGSVIPTAGVSIKQKSSTLGIEVMT